MPLLGLTGSLDGRRLRHVYRVGERRRGSDEIGALRAEPGPDRVPVWLDDGRLVGEAAPSVTSDPSPKQVLRWIVAPVAWGAVASRAKRISLVANRIGAALHRPWRHHSEAPRSRPPAGYLQGSALPGTLPLFSAVHRVTGDQLLTTVPAEATELGYGAPVLLGHLVAAAPTTNLLVRRTGSIPSWASRLGLRNGADPFATGAITRPDQGATVDGAAFRVAGWAMLAGEGVARVECFLNGRLAGRARLGLPRPAPQRLWRSPEAFVSGFDFWVGESALEPDASRVTVEALVTGMGGREFVLAASVPLSRTTVQAPAGVNSREPLTRRRGDERPARMRDDKLRVLAFTHRLDAGGAQRYFCEQVRRLAERSDISAVVVAPGDGDWRSYLEAAGVEVRLAPGYPTGTRDEYESSMRDLAALVADRSFDAAFVNTLDSFAGADLADRLGLPVAWAIHESFELPVWWTMVSREKPEPYPQTRLVHSLERAQALLFAADATKALYRAHAPGERMLLAPYGLEVEEIDDFRRERDGASLRRRLGVPEGAVIVLCLSVIEPRKGQVALARAFAEVAARHPEAHLVLVGDTGSPYCSALHRYVDSSHIADRCTIVPLTMSVYPWHAVADVFALASNVESSPIAILEAMAFETPVAASRIFGVPELITDGRDGYLFEESDVADLARTLDRVLAADPAERRAVGLAGSRRVRDRHDPKRYADNLEWLLRRLVEDPAAMPVWGRGSSEQAIPIAR